MTKKSSAVPSLASLLLVFLVGHLTGSNRCSVSLYSTTLRKEQLANPTPSATTTTNPSFTELVNASGSDKYFLHHYEHYYTDWLEPYRQASNLTFLEIGVLHGESLRMWDSYFGGTATKRIYGLGYGDFDRNANVSSNTEIIVGDQSKEETMERAKAKGPFEVIIDDGSHIPQHQVFTFFHLWNSIKPGGSYIVEDLEVNYWNPKTMPQLYGYLLNNTGFDKGPQYNAVDKFKQFIDILPRNQLGRPGISIMKGDETICGMDFGKNVMRFRKCTDLEMAVPPAVKTDHTYTGPRLVQQWRKAALLSNPAGFRDETRRAAREGLGEAVDSGSRSSAEHDPGEKKL